MADEIPGGFGFTITILAYNGGRAQVAGRRVWITINGNTVIDGKIGLDRTVWDKEDGLIAAPGDQINVDVANFDKDGNESARTRQTFTQFIPPPVPVVGVVVFNPDQQ